MIVVHKEKIKILFVQKMNGVSGSELYLLQIMPELKKRGYYVEMLIFYPSNAEKNKRFIQNLSEFGIKTHEIYKHRIFSPILLLKFARILKKGRYDVVQANLVHANFLSAITKLLLFSRFKLLSVKHGYHPRYQDKFGFDLKYIKLDPFFWVEKFSSSVADLNVTISLGLYKVYTDGKIVNKSKVKNIYYGIDLTNQNESEEVNTTQMSSYALIIGRLVGMKGHKYLIEAWRKVNQLFPEFKLFIVGGGELHAELKRQIDNLGLSNSVCLLGHISNPHDLIKHSEFTIVTSPWEGFGFILLESWMHKKPIVAFDVPAMNEVIDDTINGLLVPFPNTNILADKIIYLHENPTKLIEMGENGFRKLTTYYTLRRMADETESVYKTITQNSVT
jgi:glycosyltransferase involved in cell wall biosynthesis